MRIIDCPSPNYNERSGVNAPDMLVLHYTGMQSCEAAVARLTDPQARVSAHYTVDEDGTVYAHVPESARAWHAGVSSWRGHDDINSRSVGIEIVNPGHEFGYRPFPAAQISSVLQLGLAVVMRHDIPARNVVGHSDVAPERKEDPGELFPWQDLAIAGLGVWFDAPELVVPALSEGASGIAVSALQGALARYGYGIEATGHFDAKTVAVVRAFQRHFRPARIDGIADAQTLARLQALNEKLDRIA